MSNIAHCPRYWVINFIHNCLVHPLMPIADLCLLIEWRTIADSIYRLHESTQPTMHINQAWDRFFFMVAMLLFAIGFGGSLWCDIKHQRAPCHTTVHDLSSKYTCNEQNQTQLVVASPFSGRQIIVCECKDQTSK